MSVRWTCNLVGPVLGWGWRSLCRQAGGARNGHQQEGGVAKKAVAPEDGWGTGRLALDGI
ncbi:MAG: hypothetical protein WCE75_08655 [Terracidiphilus sp.]